MTSTAPVSGRLQELRNFVHGGFVGAADGEFSDVVDPTTGEVYARAPVSGDRDVDAALRAAADLGANAWVTFRKITFPLIMPGILAGALMAFALSIDDFVTSNFVSGSAVPFPVWVYGATRIGIPPQVFVFGSAIFAVGILCAIASIVIGWRKPA